MHRMLALTFNFAIRPKIGELEPVFTAIGDDWIRFSPLGWILWTDKPAQHVYTLLVRYLDTTDGVLITAIATEKRDDMFALFPDWVWIWLNSKYESGGPTFDFGDAYAEQLKLPLPK